MAKHRRRMIPDPPVDVDLPITPMLDLAFQVLLFFILTYQPSSLEGQVEMLLPDLAQAKAAVPENVKPSSSVTGQLELPAEVTVLLYVRRDGARDGSLGRIVVQEKQGNKEVPDRSALQKYLEKIRPGLANTQDIKLAADSDLKNGVTMEIMDVCTKAGFTNISLGKPLDQAGEP
jgi:biopolymer transport protein ExbD